MDRSLDDTIAERQRSNRGRRAPPAPRRNNYPRDGVRKPVKEVRTNLDDDWVHDRFDDEPAARNSYSKGRSRRDEYDDRRAPDLVERAPPTAKLRVDNLHYDLTEEDINDLFERIAPVVDLSMRYDRAGRSEGVAFVTYSHVADARAAIREFDGANAKGQPIRLTLLPIGPSAGRSTTGSLRDNPFDRVENPRSLFDRIEAPSGRGSRRRSESPIADDGEDSRYNSRGPRLRGAANDRRSDMTKPPPENIDRYVPGQSNGRSPTRRGGREGGRRPGERRERGGRSGGTDRGTSERGEDGRKLVNGRPRKTQEELDAEMEDYWGSAATADTAQTTTTAAPAVAAPVGDDDIDMIE